MKASSFVSFRRNLSFLSPRSWIGVHNALKRQIPNSDFVFRMVSVWLIHILIPFLLLTTLGCIPLNSPSTRIGTCARRSFVVTCISPMAITQTAQVLPHMTSIANRLRLWSAFRKEAELDASDALASALSNETALRSSHCDIYFPRETTANDRQKAMLFIPGFCVDHTAYARIASLMASEGNIIVAVLSLEPFRLADQHLLDLVELRACMKTVTKIWNQRSGYRNNLLDWSIGGHSYGGYAAMRLAPDLATHLNKSSNDKIKTVVWAAGNREEFITDLSHRDDIDAIVLLGSNDGLCSFDKTSRSFLQLNLPRSACIEYIEGANHENFASYPGESGSIEISRLEQHEQVSRKTIGFLFDHHIAN